MCGKKCTHKTEAFPKKFKLNNFTYGFGNVGGSFIKYDELKYSNTMKNQDKMLW